MHRLTRSVLVCGPLLSLATYAPAAVVDNFDSYTPGTNLSSNGWTSIGSGGSIIYPDTPSGLVPPSYPPLEGSQSVYIYSNLYGRGWGSAAGEVSDGAVLSALIKKEVASGQSWFFLSHNIAAGSTPAGIIIAATTGEILLEGNAETSTGVYINPGTLYKFEMATDFANSQFEAFYTDITNGGSRTSLGVQAMPALTIVDTASAGGVFIGNVGSAAFWDDIQINAVPEPASIGLLGLAGVMLLRRRNH